MTKSSPSRRARRKAPAAAPQPAAPAPTALAAAPSPEQPAPSGPPHYDFRLTPPVVVLIGEALAKYPFERVADIMNGLQAAVVRQNEAWAREQKAGAFDAPARNPDQPQQG